MEDSAESRASVIAVVPLMLLLMLTPLIFQLRSFPLLAMVLSVVPLGLVGVVGALLVSGRPLGFVAILGIFALIGMIAKNSVSLISQIEQEPRHRSTDLGRRLRREHLARAADHAHCPVHGAGPHTDRANGVLGSHGICSCVGCQSLRC